MKHRTIATALILFVLLFFMIWSFSSSAANPGPVTRENSLAENEASEVFQQRKGEEGEDADADLGKWGSRMDREEYLRERDEYIGLKRGFEAGLPFNPDSVAGRSIRWSARSSVAHWKQSSAVT